MNEIDIEKLYKLICSYVEKKKEAALILATYFNCDQGNLFYKYLRREFIDLGVTDSGDHFLFHGYGCSVKNENSGLDVELEFGPHGEVCSFDKFTLCHFLGFKIEDCEKVINILTTNKIIELADRNLFNLLEENSRNNIWESEEQEMDACVADRYVLI